MQAGEFGQFRIESRKDGPDWEIPFDKLTSFVMGVEVFFGSQGIAPISKHTDVELPDILPAEFVRQSSHFSIHSNESSDSSEV